MNAVAFPKTELALSLPDDLQFSEWQELGQRLAGTQHRLNWWIGDWWAYGEHRYGDRAKAAAQGAFGRDFKTLANVGSIARRFETSRRREHLSFSHHETVAGLDPADADTLLDRAESEGWSKTNLRVAVSLFREERGDFMASSDLDDDPEYAEVLAIARAWNRCSMTSSRETFLELANEADLGTIDP